MTRLENSSLFRIPTFPVLLPVVVMGKCISFNAGTNRKNSCVCIRLGATPLVSEGGR